MIEHFLTLDTFRKGLNSYLVEYQYANANRNDLWDSLNEAAQEDGVLQEGLTVGGIMEAWTVQGGYPVVTVEVAAGRALTLSQKRFYLNPSADAASDRWTIPVSVAYPGGSFDDTLPEVWILQTEQSADLEVAERPYVLNVQETGYFRVNYDADNWRDLAEVLLSDREQVGRLNRAQVYDDSINLARAGQLGYPAALNLSRALEIERDYIPLEAGLRALYYVNTMFRDTPDIVVLDAYMRRLVGPNYDELGFDIPDDEGYLDVLRRASVINVACRHQLQVCGMLILENYLYMFRHFSLVSTYTVRISSLPGLHRHSKGQLPGVDGGS